MEALLFMIIGAVIWSIFTASSDDSSNNKSPSLADSVSNTTERHKKWSADNTRRRQRAQITTPEIDMSDDFEDIINKLENTNNNFFITGRAGTGKSTVLQYFRATTNKSVVVLAPTGVAALNVQGQTIHSFFKFGIDTTLDKVRSRDGYENIEVLIIDEISMVRSDLFDCVEKFLRLNGRKKGEPFGGVQIILIGDLYQLPPVVKQEEESIFNSFYKSPYFFDAHSYEKGGFKTIELKHVYRQHDRGFVETLDSIRNAGITDKQILKINKRVIDEEMVCTPELAVKLVPTNNLADQINMMELEKIPEESYTFEANIMGEIKKRDFPTDTTLKLKRGAHIMLLNNECDKKWVNGTLGKIVDIGRDIIKVQFQDGTIHDVTPYEWEKIRFFYNKEESKIDTEVIGKFKQLPVRLAWAVTIHKSQGKTIDKVVVNMGNGAFASGQTYVALSRCRRIEDLFLVSPLDKKDVFVDDRICKFHV